MLAAFLLAVPARADEEPLQDELRATLTDLLPELRQSYGQAVDLDSLLLENNARRQQLSDMIRAADEVTIMLYTQRPDFAFDMAFALERVSAVYDSFHEQSRLSDTYLSRSRSGLRRYVLLKETLQDLSNSHQIDSLAVSDSLLLQDSSLQLEPLVKMDGTEKAMLDSCLNYLDSLTVLYGKSLMLALQDSVSFAETEVKLRQAYDYARSNYAATQKSIFIGGNVNVVSLFKDWDFYVEIAKGDLQTRFGQRIGLEQRRQYWRMAGRLMNQFFWLIIAIIISLLIRVGKKELGHSLGLYLPTLVLAFLVILLRAIFLPASLVPFLLPLTMLVFIGWQVAVNLRLRKYAERVDLMYTRISVGVMATSGVLSLIGYSMVGVLLLTFWTFQLALLHTIAALFYLIRRYNESRVTRRKARYHEENPFIPFDDKDSFIEVTWFYDLLHMVVSPIVTVFSLLLSMQFTSRAYQLSLTGTDFLHQPFFQGEGLESLESITLLNLLMVIVLFFVFRYLIYVVKAMARMIKLREVLKKTGEKKAIKESDVNLSLPHALFTLLGWMLYVIIVFEILHVSTKAMTTITTGLAAGIGFALKDLINNFFYGVQLMAGRIRVGDKISCDGVRGIVRRVSYQTTQVEDEDGSIIAFTNTDLFAGKFRNLNSGRSYEILRLPVGVRYGTDTDKARKVILEAIEPLKTKDKYGRDILDPKRPIEVRFDGFGDSSVNLLIVLYSTVETHYTFASQVMEAVYNAFAKNGIEIPFPQRDVHIKTIPEQK